MSGWGKLPSTERMLLPSLAHGGCVLALCTKWRKGIVWLFFNPSSFKVALASWKLRQPTLASRKLCQPTRLRSSLVLLCFVLGVAFGNSMGSTVPRNQVSFCCSSGFFHQNAITERRFHSRILLIDCWQHWVSLVRFSPAGHGYWVKQHALATESLTCPYLLLRERTVPIITVKGKWFCIWPPSCTLERQAPPCAINIVWSLLRKFILSQLASVVNISATWIRSPCFYL